MSNAIEQASVSRRTIIGAAWAAPVVIVVAGAPLASASVHVSSVTLSTVDTGNYEPLTFNVIVNGTEVPSTITVSYRVSGDPYLVPAEADVTFQHDEYTGGYFNIYGQNNSGELAYGNIVVTYEGVSSNSIGFTQPPAPTQVDSSPIF